MVDPKKASRPWDNAEIAFILNYSDYCRFWKKDYQASIVGELYRVRRTDNLAPTARSWNAVRAKFRHIFPNVDKTVLSTLLRDGTGSLDLRKIPNDILEEMNKQRDDWGFELLDGTKFSGVVMDASVKGFTVSAILIHHISCG
jgi:hypothetical protein